MKVGTGKIEGRGYSNTDASCKIIVYGWTLEAEQFRYQYVNGGGYIFALVATELPEYWYGSKLIKEEGFWDNIGTFCDKETFIYVAYPFDSKQYKETKSKLETIGLNEFLNFLSSEAYGRKMVIMNANCHVLPYSKYLLASKRFCEE